MPSGERFAGVCIGLCLAVYGSVGKQWWDIRQDQKQRDLTEQIDKQILQQIKSHEKNMH